MIGFARLMIVGLIGLTLAYWLMLIYMRSLRREALEKDWDKAVAEGQQPGPREAFVEDGLAAYEGSLRRKLIWLEVIVPICLFGILLYVMNFSS